MQELQILPSTIESGSMRDATVSDGSVQGCLLEARAASFASQSGASEIEPLSNLVETWLIAPISSPDFSLPDLNGKTWTLAALLGKASPAQLLERLESGAVETI